MGKRNVIRWIILLLSLSGVILALFIITRWKKPLGPSLELPTLTPSIASTATVSKIQPASTEQNSFINETVTLTQLVVSILPATALPSPTATKQPICGSLPSLTILAVGSDQRGTGYMYGLGDSIHIAHIDFTTANIMVIDFPRDLWVEIPGISDHHGITHGKLNQAYLYGNPGMGYYDGPGEGPGLLARTLDLNFGLRVERYVAIDTQTFIKLIDAVGGVDIPVESPIDLSYGFPNPGPEYFLSPGINHLDGERALILATNRIPSTFQRMIYQRMILNALREKLLSPEMLPKIPKLVAQFITSVQTDLSLNEINSLICIGQIATKEDIRIDSFPQKMFKASNIYDPDRRVYTFIYEADFNQIRVMVTDFMNGIWPFPKDN